VENATRSGVFLTEFSAWIADEALSRMFDISSQSKQELRSKRTRKIGNILGGYPNLPHGCDFLVLT